MITESAELVQNFTDWGEKWVLDAVHKPHPEQYGRGNPPLFESALWGLSPIFGDLSPCSRSLGAHFGTSPLLLSIFKADEEAMKTKDPGLSPAGAVSQ